GGWTRISVLCSRNGGISCETWRVASVQPEMGYHRLRAWLARPAVQLAVALLILAWTGLTVTEIAVATPWLEWVSFGFGVLFAFELGVRFVASTSRARFFREHWADLVAIASVAPGLAAISPATRLL